MAGFQRLVEATDVKQWLCAWDSGPRKSFRITALPNAEQQKLLQHGVTRTITSATATGLDILLRMLRDHSSETMVSDMLETLVDLLTALASSITAWHDLCKAGAPTPCQDAVSAGEHWHCSRTAATVAVTAHGLIAYLCWCQA